MHLSLITIGSESLHIHRSQASTVLAFHSLDLRFGRHAGIISEPLLGGCDQDVKLISSNVPKHCHLCVGGKCEVHDSDF